MRTPVDLSEEPDLEGGGALDVPKLRSELPVFVNGTTETRASQFRVLKTLQILYSRVLVYQCIKLSVHGFQKSSPLSLQ